MRKRAGIFGITAMICVWATTVCAADIMVSSGWFRALPSGQPAGGYFTMHNRGAAPAELVAASSTACGMIMLHRSVESSGMSRMMDVTSVSVPANGTVAFAPGGYHLMCMDPGSAMAPGKTVPVTLVFSDGSKTHADFGVKNAAGK
jgi:copper(I)-binding protein